VSVGGVSFVVIAYNEQHAIVNTLTAIDALDSLGDHEIIVVDDGSTDETAQRVTAYTATQPCVRLIRQDNAGRGAARSRGLSDARLDLVAMVDADVELPTDWLVRCLPELHDDVGAVGGVAVPEGDSTWIHRVFRLDPRPTPLEETVTGNNLLSPRATMVRIGFASELRTAEDVLFVHQLKTSGTRAVCIPGLVCIHREHKGLARTLAWMFESGVSATHQLLRFRPLRLPDLAFFGGLVTSVLVGLLVDWQWALGTVAVWLLAVSTGHVRRSFLLHGSPRYAVRWIGASVTNAMLIATYFSGRIVGFVTRNPIARTPRRIDTGAA
jgi:glycosyltransferase involved in cell wall biosynthesis